MLIPPFGTRQKSRLLFDNTRFFRILRRKPYETQSIIRHFVDHLRSILRSIVSRRATRARAGAQPRDSERSQTPASAATRAGARCKTRSGSAPRAGRKTCARSPVGNACADRSCRKSRAGSQKTRQTRNFATKTRSPHRTHRLPARLPSRKTLLRQLQTLRRPTQNVQKRMQPRIRPSINGMARGLRRISKFP